MDMWAYIQEQAAKSTLTGWILVLLGLIGIATYWVRGAGDRMRANAEIKRAETEARNVDDKAAEAAGALLWEQVRQQMQSMAGEITELKRRLKHIQKWASQK